MNILAFESSCDETSAAVVTMEEGSRIIRSNIVASQIERHRRFGGVVPEVAGRAHIECIARITSEALTASGLGGDINSALGNIDAVAVTNTPGLIGALLVGVNFAKSLAFANNKPLIPVNHIRGHVAASYLSNPELEPPFLALVASGGHTSIIDVSSYTDYNVIGYTRDDAAGEAFDKAARVLGIPYPGGAEMDRLAKTGDPNAIRLPSPAMKKNPDDTHAEYFEFSFSGLKTAVINYVNTAKMRGEEISREDVAASFTNAVCRAVTQHLSGALELTGRDKLVFAGGVAANSHLRRAISEMCAARGARFFAPSLPLCGDNAAMIGAQAYYEYLAGVRADTSLNARATGE